MRSWYRLDRERADAQRRGGNPCRGEVVDVLREDLARIALRLDRRGERCCAFTIRSERECGDSAGTRDQPLISSDVGQRDRPFAVRARDGSPRLQHRDITLRLRAELIGLRDRDLRAVPVEEREWNRES